jgi:hypothetical protein
MIKMIVSIFCCILLLGACKSQQNSGSEEKTADKAEPKTEVLEITQLAAGGYSGVNEASNKMITSMEEFYELWKQTYANRRPQPAIPEVNFEESVVIACFMGMRNTGGFAIKVSEVRKSGTTLEVVITQSSPGRNCMVTEALTQPFYIGKVSKGDIKDASFSTKSETVECDE